ncbi:hypothetical protein [Rhizobium sp. WYJ-E13]|uniref:hypothetical protein n=1 Tax=Rhizobium sp. WYJ-E13 TaxID=2849093 RepID=UPI001C1F1258|nr:hypothetical protein [Rhizobium sp. WYJ-E13]QWW70050.1 hypothetical protein KQ933_10295 [Rhizobium sp. WYJ-E13]
MSDFLEYSFRIIGPKPETIAMSRLAAYMTELAKLIGASEQVHFKEVRDKSVSIVALADEELVAFISPRIREAALNDNDTDAAAPWRKLNEYLAEDGWTAEMPLPKGGELISFPGVSKASKPIRIVNQHTSVQGRLIRIEGAGDKIKVGLEIDGDLNARISIDSVHAISLARLFHQYVRVSGDGKWRRDTSGKWFLDNLAATSFDALDDEPLVDTLEKLREILPDEGGENLIKALNELRRA